MLALPLKCDAAGCSCRGCVTRAGAMHTAALLMNCAADGADADGRLLGKSALLVVVLTKSELLGC